MTTSSLEEFVRPAPADPAAARVRPTSDGSKAHSPSLMMLVLIATLGVLLYAGFLLRPDNRGDLLPYLIVVAAESCLIAQALISLWTILSSGHDSHGFAFHNAQARLFDTAGVVRSGAEHAPQDWVMFLRGEPVAVDVFITTYGEDHHTIRRTVAAAVAMHGRHRTYVLDDGRSDDVRRIALELGAHYIRRGDNKGAKAGNINNALAQTDGEYFVIFDADFVPVPEFLEETIPFFATERVAFVQSPQQYGNLHSLISRGAAYMQSVFYSLIQPGKNRFNAAFCVGTNVVFRRSAIASVGGMYEGSKSEDIWTSILLHERGWLSVYAAKPLATGETPENIEAYTKQQLRWATGGFEILFRHNPWRRRYPLTFDQRLQYFGTCTFYLNGIAPGLLLLVPPLHIYLNLTPVNLDVSVGTWLFYYAGFYFMQIVVALFTIGSFRWETLMLATASFSIYAHAFMNALLRREKSWHVTGRVGLARSPFNYTMPQLLTFTFLALTTVVGLWKVTVTNEIALSLVWNTINTIVLGAFVAVAIREALELRRQRRTRSPALSLGRSRRPLPAGGTS